LVAVALAAGIFIDRHVPLPPIVWMIAAGVGLLAWRCLTQFTVADGPTARIRTAPSVLLLLAAVTACGALRHHLHWHSFAANDIGRFARQTPQPLAAEVIALSSPRYRPAPPFDPLRSLPEGAHTRLTVEAAALRNGGQWQPVAGRATMIVEGTLLGVHAGDRLRVVGQFQLPLPPANPGEFDFAQDRRAHRELCTIRIDNPDAVQVIEPASALSATRILGAVRAEGSRLLWSTLSHERAGLAAAVLLGAREELDAEEINDFLVTGTVHILSISGLHVGILALVLFGAFRTGIMRREVALAAVVVLTWAYTLLTDSEPPAIRATVLVTVFCGALWIGRRLSAANSLALAAIVVLLINPAELFRTGTQLSFISVAVLSAMAVWSSVRPREDALGRLIRRTRPMPVRLLRDLGRKMTYVAFAGLMIWLATSPLVLHRFSVISFSGLILNSLLWIPVFFAMASGFAVLTLGWLVPPLASVFGAVCDFNLSIIESSIAVAASLPGSYRWTAGPPQVWLVLFYAIVAVALVAPRLTVGRRVLAIASAFLAVCLVPAGLQALTHRSHELACGFVSVGHGCAVVMELPDGQVWLYDAGRLGSPRAGSRAIEAYLRSRHVSHIDAVILSHADIDHYNALPSLLQRFSVGAVYVSPQMFKNRIPPLVALEEAIDAAGVRVDLLAAGDQLMAGGCIARVLHPPSEGVSGNDNANSIVLSVEHAGRRILLTGDLEPPGLARLIGEPPLDCDVLLAPHHGSPRSLPDAVVSWSTPEWAVITTAHPFSQNASAYTSLLGPRALNTADVGAVRAVLGADSVNVRAWRIDPWE
jgi:competence protein ComEC